MNKYGLDTDMVKRHLKVITEDIEGSKPEYLVTELLILIDKVEADMVSRPINEQGKSNEH